MTTLTLTLWEFYQGNPDIAGGETAKTMKEALTKAKTAFAKNPHLYLIALSKNSKHTHRFKMGDEKWRKVTNYLN